MNRALLMCLVPLVLVGCTTGATRAGEGSPPAVSQSSAIASPAVAPRVVLDVGHCWVGYLRHDGETWALTKRQQFGYGGGMPQGFRSKGQVSRISDSRLLYVDSSGQRLVFIPVDSPEAYTTEGLVCA